jgi:uncharacterized C2H2 Zn-finger protein
MARYTPKLRPAGAGGGPARPKKTGPAHSPGKKTSKPGAFKCPACEKRFNTAEALATHAEAAHGTPVDPAKMPAVPASQVRCPVCGAPVRKRNLAHHLRFVHETA